MSRPWMPLYVADYLADTAHLSAIEHGAYMLLIMHYWRHGGLPDDEKQLARIARLNGKQWRLFSETLKSFFHSGWRHKRIDQELEKQEQISSKRSASAKQKHSNCTSNAEQLHTQSQSQSQSQKKEKKDTGKSLTLLPDTWAPSADHYELGKKLGLSTDAVSDAAAEMRAWSLGNGEKRRDWDHVFNNWLRRNAKNGQRRSRTLHDDSRSLTKAAAKLIEQAKRGEFSFGPRPGLPPESGANIVQLLPKGRGDGT